MSEERAERAERGAGASDLHTWVGGRLDVRLVDGPTAGPLRLTDLAGLAVRRNPRRAHLIVSRVLGKHLPVDPRLAYAAARLLGERVAAVLGAPGRPRPLAPLAGALRGDTAALAALSFAPDDAAPLDETPLVIGYAETATALGHAVADAFAGARYLHSTRRPVRGMVPVGTFDEAHSHATEHLLLPADPAWLTGSGPVVLVDDELTTGRTAAATIRALHRLRRRSRYVVATLLDLRSPGDRAVLAEAAAELNVRIDVVALAAGALTLPPDVLDRGRTLVAELTDPPRSARASGASASRPGARASRASASQPGPGAGGVWTEERSDEGRRRHEGPGARASGASASQPGPGSAPVRRINAAWPADLPEGGRHGFAPAHRAGLRATAAGLAREVAAGLPAGARVLVLGTEELMYAPLLLAVELTRHRGHVRYSSTTRSPVLAVDEPGYAIRTALQFPAHDGGQPQPRYAYNVAGGGFDAIVLVVDRAADTAALAADGGLVPALRRECGSLTIAVVPDWRPAGALARSGRLAGEGTS